MGENSKSVVNRRPTLEGRATKEGETLKEKATKIGPQVQKMREGWASCQGPVAGVFEVYQIQEVGNRRGGGGAKKKEAPKMFRER